MGGQNDVGSIKRIPAILAGPGNPVFITRRYFIVVGLESSALETSEFLALVIDCRPSLGIRHTPNPGRTDEVASLAFDIHDSCFVGHGISCLGSLMAHGDYDAIALTGRMKAQLFGRTIPIFHFALAPDFRTVYTDAGIWNLETGRLQKPNGFHAAAPGAFSEDGRIVFTRNRVTTLEFATPGGSVIEKYNSGGPASIQSLDLSTGKVHDVSTSVDHAFLAVSPDGKLLLSSDYGSSFALIEAATGSIVHSFDVSFVHNFAGFSRDGDSVIVTDIAKDVTHIFETVTGHEVRTLSTTSQNGALAGSDRVIFGAKQTEIWNWRTGQRLHTLDTGPVSSVAASLDGRWMVVGSEMTGNTDRLSLWDLDAGKMAWAVNAWGAEFVAFSPDGHFILTSGHTGITNVYDARNGRFLCSFVAFGDGSWAVSDSEGRYDSSNPDGGSGLHWVAGSEVIELGQLKQRFYTPGLLARILHQESLPDVKGIQTVRLFPEVQYRPVAAGSAKLQVRLINRGGGLGRVASA